MKIVNFTAAWVGILAAPLMAGATPTLSTPTVSPVYAAVNVKTQFTASCKLNTASGDPTPLAAGINLVRLTSAGADVAVLGVMHDDGLNGDAAAGDGIFTLQFNSTETSIGSFQLQCDGAFPSQVRRVQSPVVSVAALIPPSVTSLSTTPASPIAGQAFSLNVVGANFDPASAQIVINGPSCTPCVLANGALTSKSATSVAGSATLVNGAYTVAVRNTATTAISGTLALTVGSGPSVTSLSTTPSTPVATQAFSLTVAGANFDPASAILVITGTGCSPCTVANSALTAKSATSVTGPATLATAGSYTVAVQNGASGPVSGTLALTVASLPTLTSLSTTPSTAIGGQAFSLSIVGTNFDPATATIVINGPGCSPCTVANSALTAKSATSITGPATLGGGSFTVAVQNTATGANSATLPLTVATPPVLTSLSTTPSTAIGGQAFTLTIVGTGFDPATATIVINGPSCSPCTVATSALTAKSATSITGPATLGGGSFTIAVQNTATGATSGTLPLSVVTPPVLTSLSTTPATPIASQAFSLTIVGTGFDPATAQILINGPGCTPCTITNSALTAKSATSVTASTTLANGAYSIAVQNTATTATSGTLPLTVGSGPAVTSLSTTPATPIATQAFSLTIVGTNFDPATATIVITGPSCTPCTVANSALTAKSATSVTGPATLGGGSFTVAVQNTASGATSGTLALTVVTPPALTSLSTTPTTPIATQAFSLTIVGTNFDPTTATIVINGPSCTPCTVANSALTAKSATSITGPATLGGGSYTVAVQNTASGATSGTLALTVVTPPALTSLSTTPTTPIATQAFSLTIVGTNFDPATATIVITGPSCSPCTVANSALTAKSATSITGPATLGGGSFTVAVQNTASGASSGTLALTVGTAPALTSLSTTPATAIGGQAFSLTIVGTNFDPATATIVITGPSCTPCTVANSALTAKSATSITGPATLGAGSFTIAVQNTATSATSGTLPLTVATQPVLTSLSTTPATPLASQAFSLTIVGTGFDTATATIVITGSSCTPCTVANSALTAKSATSITGPATLGAGSFTVAVQNTATGATSGTLALTVAVVPALTSLSTTPAPPVGGQAFTITIVGTNFDPATATLAITGPSCTPCTVANSALTAKSATSLTGPATLANGSFTVAVVNTATGASSGTLPLAVGGTAPAITSISTTPTTPVAATSFSFILTGTNFVVATSQILINGPGCAPCTIANGSLSGATTTQLAASTTLASSGSFTVAVQNGTSGLTSGTVALAMAAPPAPTITSFTPASATIGSTVTVTGTNLVAGTTAATIALAAQAGGTLTAPLASATATSLMFVIPAGTATGTIAATLVGQSATSSGTLTITPSSTFTLSTTPASATVIKGQAVSYSVQMASSNGFSQLAPLQVSGLPSGVTAAFKPAMISAGQTSILTLTAPANQAVATSTITVSAAATVDGLPVSQTTTASLAVTAPTTSFLGRTVVADPAETPLVGVAVSMVGQDGAGNATGCTGYKTTSDAAGNFALTNLAANCIGPQLVAFDGNSVTSPVGNYAGLQLVFTLVSGSVVVSPVLVHLPIINTAETFNVIQNNTVDQSYTFKTIPGLKITVYAGTTFTKQDGTKPDPFPLAAVEVPVDRLPDVMPTTTAGIGAFIVAFQPAESNASAPVAVWYPNTLNTPAGTNVPLMTLDPTKGRMVPYGTGTISTDGTTIIPDVDPSTAAKQQRYGIVHFDWHGPLAGPPNQNDPPPDPCAPCAGDPVNLASGLEVLTSTDIAFTGNRGAIALSRTYRTLAVQGAIPPPFGWGSFHNFEYRLDTLSPQSAAVINFILPSGTRIPFTLQSDGTLVNTTVPMVAGWVMRTAGDGTATLTQKNGSYFKFTPGNIPTGSVLVAIADPNGNVTSIVRVPGAPNQIAEIDDPVGRKLTFQYNGNTISQITDPIGRTVSYTYNSAGYLATFTNVMGGVTSYQYDSQSRVTQITDPHGSVTQNTYDSNGRVISQVLPNGGATTYAYTLVNSLVATSPVSQTAVTDPLGNTTTYRFNTKGFLVGVTDAGGQARTFNRQSGSNLVLSITGTGTCAACGTTQAGNVNYTYDNVGNILSQTDGLGNSWTFTYDPVFSNVTSSTDPLGNVTQRFYDSRGNLNKIVDPRGNTTLFTVDTTGLVTAVQDATGNMTRYSYSSVGDLITVVDPAGQKTQLSYDGASRLVAQKDALGRTSSVSYNSGDEATTVVDGNGHKVQFAYDIAGLLSSYSDANGGKTSFAYDAAGRVVSKTDPLARVLQYQYDQDDNRISFTNRRGQQATYAFDALNRVVKETYADSTVQRQYDSAGRLSQVVDSQAGTFTMAYDAAGRLTSSVGPNGAVTYVRDADGRVISRQVKGQQAATYTYDAGGNLATASLGSVSVNRTFDARNLLTATTRSNGVAGAYSFDPVGRILSMSEKASSTTLFSRTFTYDPAGQVSADAYDNGLPYTTAATAASFDAANEITAFGSTTYTSDADGNRLGQTIGGAITNYTWDARGRLRSISAPGGVSTSFVYDFIGNLIQQRVTSTGSDNTQTFVLDDISNIVSVQSSGAAATSVLDGRTPDDIMATIQGGTATFPLADQIGSAGALTDATGNILARQFYEPFGAPTGAGGVGLFQFTGRPQAGNGIYYDRARFYDSATGRFLSEDPLGLSGGSANPYNYVNGNPISRVDPFGLTPDLGYTTLSGGPNKDTWQIQWKLSKPSKNGGWIVQQINATTAGGAKTTYWEAWQVAANSSVTTYANSGDPNDDLFRGFSGITGTARFYEGLNLPDSFVPNGVGPAGILPATTDNPNLGCQNASPALNRRWHPK